MFNDKSRLKYLAPQSGVFSLITEAILAASDTYDGNATFEDFEAIDLYY